MFFGTHISGGAHDGTFVFNINSNSWTRVADRDYRGDHSGIHAINGKIYVVGGFQRGKGLVQIYNIATNTWTTNPNQIPGVAEGSLCTAEIGGKIYACGGLGGGTNPDSCFMYEPSSGSWSSKTDMLRGVDHAATGTDGIKM